MVKVCEKEYPKGTKSYQKSDGFYIHPILKAQIDILLKNIKNDWDFTIIITGGGEVRVGKSVLAMQIGAYWTSEIKRLYGKICPWNLKSNFVFQGDKLIKQGNELGMNHPYSVLIFDEAGADLEGRKIMKSTTQEVLDFLRECGQYNLLNIIVMPEYFDLPKSIALSRSIFLIDVTYQATEEGMFERGYFNFYSRPNKKMLYLKGKRDLNYRAWKGDFGGTFNNFFTINEQEYRVIKQEMLIRRGVKQRNKQIMQRDACWFLLHKEFGLTYGKISERMEQLTNVYTPQITVGDGVRHFTMENE